MRVLVVDDIASDRQILRGRLEAEGVAVGEAANGVEALAALVSEKFDAVVTDILMPRMDGYRLCREIRRDPGLRDLPIIAYSGGYVSESDEKLAALNGADRYLPKTVSAGTILPALALLLRSGAGRRFEPPPPDDSLVMGEYNSHLVRKLAEKSRELAERNEQLRFANEQLRALAARNETIREGERTTIAREIHDVLSQELTCLKIDLVWIGKQTAKFIAEPARGALAERIGGAIAQTDEAINTVQHIATELRPVILDSLGLAAAVEWQTGDFARRSGLAFRQGPPPGPSTLSRECATAVFRILQECLTNIARHAQATEIEVRLEESLDSALLTVSDNGRGITAREIADARSIGLVGMSERAQSFGGSVDIVGAAGAGTTVRVRIPLAPEVAAVPP